MNINAYCTNCKNHRTGEFSNLGALQTGKYTRTCRKCKTKWNIEVVYDESVQAIAARYTEVVCEKYEVIVFTDESGKTIFPNTYWAIREIKTGRILQVSTESSNYTAYEKGERVLRTFIEADAQRKQ